MSAHHRDIGRTVTPGWYIDGSLHARIQFVILGYRGAFEYRNVDPMTSAMPRIALALKLWSSLEKSVVATVDCEM